MSGISRKQFADAFSNAAIDLDDADLKAALAGAGLDAGRLDDLDGKPDGRVSGPRALDDLYDEIDRLDRQTAGLASKEERGLWGAMRSAAVAPEPISASQGERLASAARRLVAEDRPAPGQLSEWALEGKARCQNPDLSSPSYAGKGAWKCNVFVGESFERTGLPFPLNAQSHYATANTLPSQSRFFQPVGTLDDVRPGDLLSIQRGTTSGHVEVVTDVVRDPAGRVVSIASAGAHEDGSREGVATAAPLVAAAAGDARASRVTIGDETFRLLRPMAPPAGANEGADR
ncbi:MAG TPA: hypothetical protein VHL80_03110 [Polyangia bacterium]|nr:hypothetical protein [Polyangia bacterium]